MSFRGDLAVGRKIYYEIDSLGYAHVSTCYAENTPEEFYSLSKEERAIHYKRVASELSKADVIVVEASIHSLTIGQFIQQGLDQKISVLILCRKGIRPLFQDGVEYEENRLLILEYSLDDLKQVLKDGLDFLSEANKGRFTLILSSEIIKHLDNISKKNISRSEYIRNLILKDMLKLES
jgi:hypothetical protein